MDLQPAFGGTSLRYAAAAADASVVEVSAQGATLVLRPLRVGRTEVAATASNSEGEATQSFELTVSDAPPTAAQPLADVSLTVDGASAQVDLQPAFGGTSLRYAAAAADASVVEVSAQGATLVLRPLRVGRTEVAATASNSEGEATQSFELTVSDAPPTAAQPLADVSLTVDGASAQVDLQPAFGGTSLRYAAAAADASVVEVSAQGATLVLRPLRVGRTEVAATASNSEGEATQSFELTVSDAPPTAAQPLADVSLTVDGASAQVDLQPAFGGTSLRYAAAAADASVVEVSAQGATLVLRPLRVGRTEVAATASNSEGEATQSFEVTVSDVPPTATQPLADVLLTVDGAPAQVDLRPAFVGTSLVFAASASDAAVVAVAVRDGATLGIAPLAAGRATVTVRASNSAGEALQRFDVAVAEQAPAIRDSMPALALLVGGPPRSVDLGAAFSGTNLVFEAVPEGPGIVRVSISAATLSVAPLEEGRTEVVVAAWNSAGRAEQRIAVDVATSAAETAVLEDLLAGAARGMLANTTSMLDSRFQAQRQCAELRVLGGELSFRRGRGAGSPCGRSNAAPPAVLHAGSALGHAMALSAERPFAVGGAFDTALGAPGPHSALDPDAAGIGYPGRAPSGGMADRLLSGLAFEMPLGAGSASAATSQGRAGKASLWGRGDTLEFDAVRGAGSSYRGRTRSFHVGIDGGIGEHWLAGLALSVIDIYADYAFASRATDGETASGAGALDAHLASLLPYARYDAGAGREFWAAIGIGQGDATLARRLDDVDAAGQRGDMSLRQALLGGRWALAPNRKSGVAVFGDAGVAQLRTDGGDRAVHGLAANVSKLRFGLELSRAFALGEGAMTPFGQAAGRYDGGDGTTGAGLELVGGLRYRNGPGRVRLEGQARMLALHGASDYGETGYSLAASIEPRQDGAGFSLTLAPAWGGTAGGALLGPRGAALASLGRLSLPVARSEATSLHTRVGYGFRFGESGGLLEPFGEYRSGPHQKPVSRAGLRLSWAWPHVDVQAELAAGAGANARASRLVPRGGHPSPVDANAPQGSLLVTVRGVLPQPATNAPALPMATASTLAAAGYISECASDGSGRRGSSAFLADCR